MVPAGIATAHHVPGTILCPLDMLTSFVLDPIGLGAPETPGLLGPGLIAVPSGRIGPPSAIAVYIFFRLAAYRDSAVTPPALVLRLLFLGPTMMSVCPGIPWYSPKYTRRRLDAIATPCLSPFDGVMRDWIQRYCVW
jgi:hypothetical protein